MYCSLGPHASTQTRHCHLSMGCNTWLILIVLTGERPGISCGSIAFGCLHFSGNCFSRLGCSTASTLSESRSRAKQGASGCSVFPAGAHAANWRTSCRHRQPCAGTDSNRFWEELRSGVAFFLPLIARQEVPSNHVKAAVAKVCLALGLQSHSCTEKEYLDCNRLQTGCRHGCSLTSCTCVRVRPCN